MNLPQTLETLIGAAGQPVHALYNTPDFWVLDGQTATQWTLGWAQESDRQRATSETRLSHDPTGDLATDEAVA